VRAVNHDAGGERPIRDISTGLREHKFGLPIEEAARLYARVARQK